MDRYLMSTIPDGVRILWAKKVPTVGLREAADVLKQLGTMILPAQQEHEGLPPIQVIVHSGGPLVPNRPDEE